MMLGRQKCITANPLVPDPSSFESLETCTSSSEVEIATEKLKRYQLQGTDQIPAELIQARDNTLYYEIHKLYLE
jgi:hypothetical protein